MVLQFPLEFKLEMSFFSLQYQRIFKMIDTIKVTYKYQLVWRSKQHKNVILHAQHKEHENKWQWDWIFHIIKPLFAFVPHVSHLFKEWWKMSTNVQFVFLLRWRVEPLQPFPFSSFASRLLPMRKRHCGSSDQLINLLFCLCQAFLFYPPIWCTLDSRWYI